MRGDRLVVQSTTFERMHDVTPLSIAEMVRDRLGPDPFDGEGKIAHWIEGTNHVFEWQL